MTVKEELDLLRLEKEQLEMDILRHQVAEIKTKKLAQATKHIQVEKDLADRRNADEAKQESCNHRHGGQGMAAIQGQGDDSKFAVIKHRLPLGDIVVMCLRCGKMWDKKNPDYKAALSFPALSTLSEAAQFRIERN